MPLITEQNLELESLHQVACRAVSAEGRGIRISVGVVVLWKSGTSHKQAFWAGLQISDIDTATESRLSELAEIMAQHPPT